ncbi:MAG: FAD-dependent oxidoreductase [Gemmatimonadota bacterium]|nr:FAD-dependent oxidoreductase [Gemmatimonadota bacterium]
MRPTDVSDPHYYHRVVDCQWACPAHTNVPEYIRLIAQGRYTDAYMLNRESNVFPGILGRTCDRPCEPACRRTRLDEEPVAICRLKRVAADLREDISERLPRVPEEKNGRHVLLIGAGPASLTVANDLMPLGYEVTIYEKLGRAGGLMWNNIPQFRLPPRVLDEEIDMILDMGVDLRCDHSVESMAAVLEEGWDAVFIGTGAPRGKELELPGRWEAPDQVHIGIDWLQSIAFGHIDTIGKRVLVIGAGNTAMDCCRSAKRMGGEDVKVMARKPRPLFKASPWELEDAEGEEIEILENHSPSRFVLEDGKLVGMEFEVVRWHEPEGGGRLRKEVLDTITLPCDEVILAIGQEAAFPWIERDIGIAFNDWDMPVVDQETFQTTLPGVFCGGDAAWGPENIIWAVEHGHQAAISIHQHCRQLPVEERPPYGQNLVSVKMGLHEWSYSNDYDEAHRQEMSYADLKERLASMEVEAELGFDLERTCQEAERCLNCDVQTHFTEDLCIECDACIDVCPLDCLTITTNGDEPEIRAHLTAPAENPDQPLFASGPLPQTERIMFKDENLCIHCGLCAERCPTAAWDMRKSELLKPYAGLAAGERHPTRVPVEVGP